ncbi:FAD-dependent monooxygenase [Litoribrevibacter albus]|uniref:2-octaprenyl-3-methyl-6-methoxy-1,4-benzoquinol hydroxylase n=1 Tax=Litoribrevibacter albus TaxID=1473156 RepID=A0AA37W981_9GAMM|nr:FAD-dependent monooxygenase [Litoribrevibacter albus]GLQ32954.1 2-octaprenyl-3-methyl-6-methoxy-1,4-benzoquinol hydroxylase [Litoribrevibacter albus]
MVGSAQQTNHFDVLIVGGGMVGSAIACRLGQVGMKVAVFDRSNPNEFSQEQTPDLRVSALSPASIELLQKVKAWQNIEAMRYAPYQRMAVWEKLSNPITGKEIPTRLNRTEFDAQELNEPMLGVIVENRITQLALHQQMAELDSVELIVPADVASIEIDDQVRIELADGQVFTGELLVGADGANSMVKQWAGIGTEAKPYEQHAMVITVKYQGRQEDITWQGFTSTGPEAFLPLPDINGEHYGSLVWYNLPENIESLMTLNDEPFKNKLQRSFPDDLPEVTEVLERGSFPLIRRHAERYCQNRLVLAGDAAHTINPLAGQGVNLGFQDVNTLTSIIIEARDKGQAYWGAEVLQQYERVRRPQNAMMMRIMDLFYHTFSNDIVPVKMARNLGLSVAGRFVFGQKMVMKYAMGLVNVWPETLPKVPLVTDLLPTSLPTPEDVKAKLSSIPSPKALWDQLRRS